MKNKTKTYVLLVAVIAIWGIIGFKIMSTLNPDVPKVSQQDTVFFTPKTEMEEEVFSIQSFDRDPFLGSLNIQKKPEVVLKTKQIKEPLVWPLVIFQGTISKQENKEKTCVISINGQQYIMKAGHSRDGVKLLNVKSSEITVSYKGQKKTISKT